MTVVELKAIEIELQFLVEAEKRDSAPTSRGADFIENEVPKLIAEIRRLNQPAQAEAFEGSELG